MDSKSSRYQSRVLREMHNNADNPFSAPSSTGTHGTVTLTSQLSLPDDESTRPQVTFPTINTAALYQKFPEWEPKATTTFPKSYRPDKENKAPAPALGAIDEDQSILAPSSPKLRTYEPTTPAEDTMEPTRGNVTTLLDTLKHNRVENESAKQSSSHVASKLDPNSSFAANAARRVQRSHPTSFTPMSPAAGNQTAASLSFFLPQFNHLNDFVSGTLRLSSLKNGTPIFVKHGRVHDRDTKTSFDHHADFEAVAISEEEEKIFVSLDKIREEIQALQEHDEIVSKQAEQFQEEVIELQSLVTSLKSRRDSALGSESDSSLVEQLNTQKSQLEEQVSSLRTRLDQANRKINLNEIHHESFVAERDEALQRASDHVVTIKRLQSRNDSITAQKLELQQALKESEEDLDSERALLENLQRKYDHVATEKKMLKDDNLSLERQNESLIADLRASQLKNTKLEGENKDLQEKASQLQSLLDRVSKQLLQKSEALRIANRINSLSKEGITGTGKSKLTKLAQQEPGDRLTVVSEMSGHHSTSPLDLPQQDTITFESDFTRDSTRQLTQESKVSAPTRTKSRFSKMSHRESGNTVGSEMSARTMTSQTDLEVQDDYTQQIDLTQDRQLDSDQENMTSALFIDDITLDSTKRSARKQKAKNTNSVRVLSPILSDTESTKTEQSGPAKKSTGKGKAPALTQSAKRVLDNLCREHECNNCVLCTRINARRPDSTGKQTKKTVRVERPLPASDRTKRESQSVSHAYEDQPTLRPSQDPAVALAKVMKGLKDEEKHLQTFMSRKQAIYDDCDPALHKRLWKQLDGEIKSLRKRRDLKRDQIYDLQDVLEAQKASNGLMSQEAVDMTINSVLSRDPTWDGIMEH